MSRLTEAVTPLLSGMQPISDLPRLHVYVTGRVQGVCYRAFVLDEAQRLGLSGHVRNLRDGRVEVDARGPESALQLLAAKLRAGPNGASVSGVQEEWGISAHEPAGFRIKH